MGGNPLSPILADIVMEDLENLALSKICFPVPFYYRYVDDIIVCVPEKMIDYTVNLFNSFDNNLQFTVKRQSNNKISFLDILIIQNEQKISTDWYRKPTFSGRFLNFNSHHPISNKIGIICSSVDKCINLADIHFHDKNLNLIRDLLLENDYPKDFINKYINKRLLHIKNNNNTRNSKNINFNSILVFPFIKYINPELKNICNNYNLIMINSISNKFNHIIRLGKDKYHKNEKSHVVYKINCCDCNASYVGQTSRKLIVRS